LVGAVARNIPLISGITIVMASLGVWKALTDTPIYKASFEILTEPVTLETRIISSANPDTLSNQEDVISVKVDEAKLKLLKSPGLLNPIVDTLKADYPFIEYQKLLRGLTISTTSPNSQILEVSYSSPNPLLVKDVLALVEKAYIDFSLEERQSDVLRGIAFVDEQLPSLRSQVDELQSELEILRQENNLIDPAIQGEQLSQQVAVFVQNQLNTQVELNEARLLSLDLQKQLSSQQDQAVASPLSADSRYQEIQLELLKLDTQLAQTSTLFLQESPEIAVLQEQKANLLPIVQREGRRVMREVMGRIQELENRNQSLGSAIQTINRQIQSLSSATRRYSEIQQELAIATNNLNQFLSKREALRIDAAQRQAPWQLLREAAEPQVSVASASRNLVLGTVAGLLLGILAALARDRFSSLVYASTELQDIFQVPIVGSIPSHPDADAAIASIGLQGMFQHPAAEQLLGTWNQKRLVNQEFIPFTEAFRSLYTNICLINPDEKIQSLTISCAAPNEGKTTTSIQLALAASAMGRRVILVDADLRRPSLERKLWFQEEKPRGITDLLSEDLDLEQVVQELRFHPNFFVLYAGATPPDALRVLSSQKMNRVFQDLRNQFDLIIYDTPPLLGFADAYFIAAKTQGLILVSSLGQTKRSILEDVANRLQVSQIPLLGVVANREAASRTLPYDYYQSYLRPKSNGSVPNSRSGIKTMIPLPLVQDKTHQ